MLRIYVPKTETLKRPPLSERITFRLYRALATDINNDATERDVSVNEVVLNILEIHYAQRATYALSYAHHVRPLWKKAQAERWQTNHINGRQTES